MGWKKLYQNSGVPAGVVERKMRPRIRIDIDSRVNPHQIGSARGNGEDLSETLRCGRKGYRTGSGVARSVDIGSEIRRPVVEFDYRIDHLVPAVRRKHAPARNPIGNGQSGK